MTSPIFKTSLSEFETVSTKFDVVPVRAVVSGIGFRPIDAFRVLRVSATPTSNTAAFIIESESLEIVASRYSYVCPMATGVVRTGTRETLGDIDPIARAEAVHERHWQTGEQVFEPTHTATTVITAE